jgi:hypothetical protein
MPPLCIILARNQSETTLDNEWTELELKALVALHVGEPETGCNVDAK